MRFRRNIERIGEVIAYEISKKLPWEEKDITTPLGISKSKALVRQPVLATILRQQGSIAEIHIVSVIACTEGIEYVRRKEPQVTIWCGDIDDELTAKGYIVPGLGDAGDLAFGEKTQA